MMDTITLDDKHIVDLLRNLPNGTIIPLLCTGKSMEPIFLDRKSIVYLSVGISDGFAKGDVCFFFRTDGKMVLHRVIDISDCSGTNREKKVVFNGDAQNWTEPVRTDQILAKVTGFRRKGSDDKYISLHDKKYILYWNIWIRIMVLRPFLLKLFRLFGG